MFRKKMWEHIGECTALIFHIHHWITDSDRPWWKNAGHQAYTNTTLQEYIKVFTPHILLPNSTQFWSWCFAKTQYLGYFLQKIIGNFPGYQNQIWSTLLRVKTANYIHTMIPAFFHSRFFFILCWFYRYLQKLSLCLSVINFYLQI